MTDNQYIIAYERRHRSYERKAAVIMRRLFAEQRRAVIAHIKANGVTNLSIALIDLIRASPLQEAFVKIYSFIGQAEGEKEVALFNEMVTTRQKAIGVSFSDPEWRKAMVDYMLLHSGSRITGISETTREKIMYLLALGQEEGLSTEEMIEFLLEQLRDIEFPAFSRARAQAISRTEATTAANAGTLIAGETLSIQYEKKWCSARDNRTRRTPRDKFDHLSMNGVKVQPGQSFNVSGEQLQHPGDPTGSKGNVINCRCIVRLTPVYDSNGMPAPKVPSLGRLAFA